MKKLMLAKAAIEVCFETESPDDAANCLELARRFIREDVIRYGFAGRIDITKPIGLREVSAHMRDAVPYSVFSEDDRKISDRLPDLKVSEEDGVKAFVSKLARNTTETSTICEFIAALRAGKITRDDVRHIVSQGVPSVLDTALANSK